MGLGILGLETGNRPGCIVLFPARCLGVLVVVARYIRTVGLENRSNLMIDSVAGV